VRAKRFPKIPRPPYAPRPHISKVSIKVSDSLWTCTVLDDMSIAFVKKMIEERAERVAMLEVDKENLQWEIDGINYYSYYPDMTRIPPINKTYSD
jgi:hypothetical protein